MRQLNTDKKNIKYLTPDDLHEQIKSFTTGMAVTKDSFELLVPNCTLEDFEWNHMDQMHRPSVHNTYEKGVRIALGEDFAVSLTQWKKWPLLITVSDIYVAKGLFYQTLTIAGILVLHSIISMEADGDSVKLKDEWFIASHRFFKFLHKPLHKKLYNLNKRLQDEDAQLRNGRFELRKQGYRFKTDQPNYYNSNVLGLNTIYPTLASQAGFAIDDLTAEPQVRKVGNIEFLAKKDDKGQYLVWPAACPHEGGPLNAGKVCDTQITCPWHGLRFTGVTLSATHPEGSRYGFEYRLVENKIVVTQLSAVSNIADAAGLGRDERACGFENIG